MKWRLVAAFTVLVTGALLTQDIPLASYIRTIEEGRVFADLERDAFILAGGAVRTLETDSNGSVAAQQLRAGLTTAFDLYAKDKSAEVVLVNPKGRLVLSTDSAAVEGSDYTNRPEIPQALSGKPASGQRYSHTAKLSLAYVAVPVISGGDTLGALRITMPATSIHDRINRKMRGLIIVVLISLTGAVMSALLLTSWITRPVRRLQRSTEAFANGEELGEAAIDEGPPEVRALARSFNTMTTRITGLMQQQRSFTGDASHQLRTPLTALRLQLERAAAMIDDDPERARERIEAASLETERLQRLVEGLLMMARSEGTRYELVDVDVTAIVNERAEVWEPLAAERGVWLLTSAAPNLHIRAVPNAIEQIIDNYVDNALGVVKEGDTITIAATAADRTVSVHVIDDGPGMQPDHLARAFDRFWRAPDARQGGSGIGLAVVQQLAKISGGRAELRNRTDRSGLDASAVFPKA
jgi:signal transduction histidine kinase